MEYITHVGSDGRKLGQPPNRPNKTGSRTQNSVQPSQGTKRKPSQQRTAAVNTAGYKCMDKGELAMLLLPFSKNGGVESLVNAMCFDTAASNTSRRN